MTTTPWGRQVGRCCKVGELDRGHWSAWCRLSELSMHCLHTLNGSDLETSTMYCYLYLSNGERLRVVAWQQVSCHLGWLGGQNTEKTQTVCFYLLACLPN